MYMYKSAGPQSLRLIGVIWYHKAPSFKSQTSDIDLPVFCFHLALTAMLLLVQSVWST